MDLNEEDKAICEQAIAFARKNKKLVGLEITDLAIYPADSDPVSVFMAGSPG